MCVLNENVTWPIKPCEHRASRVFFRGCTKLIIFTEICDSCLQTKKKSMNRWYCTMTYTVHMLYFNVHPAWFNSQLYDYLQMIVCFVTKYHNALHENLQGIQKVSSYRSITDNFFLKGNTLVLTENEINLV